MTNNLNKKVIVRSDKNGVFFGTLVHKEGLEIRLKNVRKLYYWSGAYTVEDLANKGVTKPNECKFTVICDEIELSSYDQIIPCTDNAIINLEKVKIWKAQKKK